MFSAQTPPLKDYGNIANSYLIWSNLELSHSAFTPL